LNTTLAAHYGIYRYPIRQKAEALPAPILILLRRGAARRLISKKNIIFVAFLKEKIYIINGC
jgi:hypothetical protein